MKKDLRLIHKPGQFHSLPVDVHAVLVQCILGADLGTGTPFFQDWVEEGLELSSYFSSKGSFTNNFQLPHLLNQALPLLGNPVPKHMFALQCGYRSLAKA